MVISNNKMVSLQYELRENMADGEVIESVDSSNPLKFLFGSGNLLPAFEENLVSKKEGDGFSFSLEAADAYGEKREDMIAALPISIFEVEGKIDTDICSVGNTVPMADRQGNRMNGIITSIDGDSVTMDFNHPLAGVKLFFSGKVLEVRDATEDELSGMNQGHSCGSCSHDHDHDHDHSHGCGGGSCKA